MALAAAHLLEDPRSPGSSTRAHRAWILAELGLAALQAGQPDAAIGRLEEAFTHGLTPDMVIAIRSDPAWQSLREDERFVRWVTRATSAEVSSAAFRQPL